MEYKQLSIQEILDTEREMVMKGGERYGEYFDNASGFNILFRNFIKSISEPEKFAFVGFWSQICKHHTLALFSAIRLHHIQTGMDLRQVLEAGSWAAYAMAFKDEDKFYEKNSNGAINVPQRLTNAKNKWLDKNFAVKSEELRRLKKLINETTAHSNVVYLFHNFKMNPADNPGFETPFFDFEDEYWVRSDLWFVANISMGILDMFYGINSQYRVFQIEDDFLAKFKKLVNQNNKLKSEMIKNKRFLDAEKLQK